jgi:hypothetical protein
LRHKVFKIKMDQVSACPNCRLTMLKKQPCWNGDGGLVSLVQPFAEHRAEG